MSIFCLNHPVIPCNETRVFQDISLGGPSLFILKSMISCHVSDSELHMSNIINTGLILIQLICLFISAKDAPSARDDLPVTQIKLHFENEIHTISVFI